MLRLPPSVIAILATLFAPAVCLAQQPVLRSFYGSSQFNQMGRSEFQKSLRAVNLQFQSTRASSSSESLPTRQIASPEFNLNSVGGPTVSGNQAVIRRGVAYAPVNAPAQVKRAIWAINRIVGARYKWGGGHASFSDDGYDCSGTVSYALHHAGVLESPMGSEELTHFGSRGRGRWITVYARRGHVFAVIAGLRLDTTDMRIGGDVGPRWHLDGRDTSNFEPRHIAGA